MEAMEDFRLWGFKITVDSDCDRVNNVRFMVSEEDLALKPGASLGYSRAFCASGFY